MGVAFGRGWGSGPKVDLDTVLLLNGEDFMDKSSFNHEITNQNVTIVEGGKFGKCYYFNRSMLTINNARFINLVSGDFTVEFWINPDFQTTSTERVISGGYIKIIRSNTGVKFIGNQYMSIQAGIWTHVAFSRRNGTLFCFANGVLLHQFSAGDVLYGENYLYIGAHTSPTNLSLNSTKLDDIRISMIARYTSNFTPPTKPLI